jgi:N-acetylglucosaminyl-diphospho-decaprenol L-rhamnosyltransferase
MSKATVSVVSHGHGSFVRRLLSNLDTNCSASIERVIVTINIPEEDVLQDVTCRFPVDIVRNAEPKGFGANHNAAFQRNNCAWFLVVNPDLRAEGDPIAALTERALDSTGLLAPRVVEPGKEGPEPRRGLLTPAEFLMRRLRPGFEAARAEWVAGMFMLFRASAFRSVGGFDERYFMYVEDADICARLRLAGWQIEVDNRVHVMHDAQRASHHQWRAMKCHLMSLMRWWTSAAFWRSVIKGV